MYCLNRINHYNHRKILLSVEKMAWLCSCCSINAMQVCCAEKHAITTLAPRTCWKQTRPLQRSHMATILLMLAENLQLKATVIEVAALFSEKSSYRHAQRCKSYKMEKDKRQPSPNALPNVSGSFSYSNLVCG